MKTLIRSLICLFSLLLVACPVEAQQSTPYYNNYNPGTNIQPAIYTANQAYAPPAGSKDNPNGKSEESSGSTAISTNPTTPYTFEPKIPSHLSYQSSIFKDDRRFDTDTTPIISNQLTSDFFNARVTNQRMTTRNNPAETIRGDEYERYSKLMTRSINEVGIKTNDPTLFKEAIVGRFYKNLEQLDGIERSGVQINSRGPGNNSMTQPVDVTNIADMMVSMLDISVRTASGVTTDGESDGKLILIEAKVISVDTSDDRTLGVEISGGNRSGTNKLFAFSRFGLNSITSAGLLSVDATKNLGLNGVMVNPDTADVIVSALSQNSHVKMESSPRVLVKNNNRGYITSSLGVPYATTIAMPAVGDKSEFAGYTSAGTVIEVKPVIIEASTQENKSQEEVDKIEFQFLVQHSNFASDHTKDEKIPPSLHGETIMSTIIIPDGYTVIVGGLNRYGTTKEQRGIPGLMHIPLIKHVASYQKDTQSRSTLFFFITAKIIDPAENEGKFDKLKYMNTQIHGLNLVPKD